MTQIADIIKYEGDNKTFVWKHPCEDFNSLTQLIVHESQEAIFFMNGQALDIFGAGRYTLETENLPILSKIIKRATGNKSPFHCEVYFINKTIQMAIKWGVGNIGYMEPTYKFPLTIGAGGELNLKVDNGKKLLIKLVGTETDLTQEKLIAYFRGIISTKVKSCLAKIIKQEKISIFEIDENLDSISESLLQVLKPEFEKYGLILDGFLLDRIVRPEDDERYQEFADLHFRQYADIADAKIRQQVGIIDEQTKAQKTIIESQARVTKRAQEGYTYQQERGFDVASEIAKNEGSGQFMNMGIGLGTMAGVGGVVGGIVNQAITKINDTTLNEVSCSNCGNKLPSNSRFCNVCGTKIEVCVQTKKTCPKCKNELPDNSKFCLQCGTKID